MSTKFDEIKIYYYYTLFLVEWSKTLNLEFSYQEKIQVKFFQPNYYSYLQFTFLLQARI